jgi:tripartite-type tricarboxylate transporter receptor subunit TctC
VIPYPPGGVHDTIARLLQPRLTEGLGQQLVIENRPGAAGNIGAETVARSPADGYTLFASTDSLLSAPQLHKNAPFTTWREFAPITKLATYPLAFLCSSLVPVSNLGELVARAKAMPGAVTVGSPGAGTQNHLVAELFKELARIDLLHVPYKGAAPAMSDVIAGRVHCIFMTPSVGGVAQAKNSKLKMLAAASAARIAVAPDVPTFAESGYPGFEAENHTGLSAPAATPAAIVERLNREAIRAIRLPDIQARFYDLGAVAAPTTPAEYAAYMRRESERWGKLIRERAIQVE